MWSAIIILSTLDFVRDTRPGRRPGPPEALALLGGRGPAEQSRLDGLPGTVLDVRTEHGHVRMRGIGVSPWSPQTV